MTIQYVLSARFQRAMLGVVGEYRAQPRAERAMHGDGFGGAGVASHLPTRLSYHRYVREL